MGKVLLHIHLFIPQWMENSTLGYKPVTDRSFLRLFESTHFIFPHISRAVSFFITYQDKCHQQKKVPEAAAKACFWGMAPGQQFARFLGHRVAHLLDWGEDGLLICSLRPAPLAKTLVKQIRSTLPWFSSLIVRFLFRRVRITLLLRSSRMDNH